jgi:GntR family transcriptional regulator/MocR family aminotransferase
MDLVLDDGDGERTVQVYRALRAAIVDGRLPAGHRLPATRVLAADLKVGRNSVSGAYERLAAEGYLAAKVGSGTFVARTSAPARPRRATADPLRPRTGWTYAPLPVSADREPPPYDFRTGIPDAGLFPFDTWRRLVAAEVRLRANSPGTYAEPDGHPALRAAIARYLGVSRTVRATGAEPVVTNGTQHALDLIGRVLLKPGDVVAVEEPGYPPARRLFESLGARVTGVPVDAAGLVVDGLPANARLVYTTPSHQFPLGGAMTPARRHALLDWARRRPVAVVEDDYDSEFRFTGRPLEPLHSLDTGGRVLYVGTFSKSMLPTVRTGFVIAPPTLREALVAARQLSDGYGQPAVQAALARFIDEGLLARHVRRAGKVYAERYARVLAGLDGVLPSSAGLHVTALLSDGGPARAAEVTARALARGVAFDDLSQYVHDSGTQAAGFVFGLGAIATDAIGPGLAIVTDLLRTT